MSPKRIITRNLFIQMYHYGATLRVVAHSWLRQPCYTFKTEHKLQSSIIYWSSPRSISIGQLNTLPCLHLQPINLVIFKGSYFIKNGKSYLEGGFTLRCLQRLSVPYIATQLCSWSATGTPEVCPSRSSRTKDSSSQISCAHNG